MTLLKLLEEGNKVLAQTGNPDGENDAKLLLLEAFHLDMVHYLMVRMDELPEDETCESAVGRYREMIGKRANHIPLQHILGSQEFMGLTFHVNEHVLIPRQDTETLVELVLTEQTDREKKILDLCTGSGCIVISLAVKGGYHALMGTDISPEALRVAKENARTLVTDERIVFKQGDLFSALKGEARFDIITANPPYIPTDVIATLTEEVREHEPVLALDGMEDGLMCYRRIAAEAGAYLNPGGRIYLEIGYDQGKAVSNLMREAGFSQVRVIKDLPGKDRVVCAAWQEN